jgi:hypothetical protein
VRIRILSLPADANVEGCDVSRFLVGSVYDVTPEFANLLIVAGYAMPELRNRERRSRQRASDDEFA